MDMDCVCRYVRLTIGAAFHAAASGEECWTGRWRLREAVIALAMSVPRMAARAESARHFSFAYDQPHSTGYGIAADLFNSKLMQASHGSMTIDQFPGAQLGQEPQMLQKIRTGDIDFMISSTANAAT